jgi:hypothetical protein
MSGSLQNTEVTQWNVPVTVKLADELPDPKSSDVETLVRQLPGGGFGTSYAGADFFKTRVFTMTMTVDAHNPDQAEQIAGMQMRDAVDAAQAMGWSVSSTGEASPAD